jgi:hypothetical protein
MRAVPPRAGNAGLQGPPSPLQGPPSPRASLTLTAAELREVTAFAVGAAAEVLPIFKVEHPSDPRPRRALEAAQLVIDGAPRSSLQRAAAPAAHRAARQASSLSAFHAAMAAGDAGASMYLHPLAHASQVNHILRAPAHAACAHELADVRGPQAARDSLDRAIRRATPTLIAVLDRYPLTRPGRTRVSKFVHHLDSALRSREPTRYGPA